MIQSWTRPFVLVLRVKLFKKTSCYSHYALHSLGGAKTHPGHWTSLFVSFSIDSLVQNHMCRFPPSTVKGNRQGFIANKILDTHYPLKPGPLSTSHNEVLSLTFCHLSQIKVSCTLNAFIWAMPKGNHDENSYQCTFFSISYKYCHQGLWVILSKNVSPSQHITQLWKMTGCILTLDSCLTLRTMIIYYFYNSHNQKGVEPIFLVF